jgi:subtilisin family serine protease
MNGDRGAAGRPGQSGRSQSGLQGRRLSRLGDRTDIAVNRSSGQEYLYRPRELLVASEDLALVRDEIARSKPERREPLDRLGIVRFTMPTGIDIPALVTRLRAAQTARVPRVGPNHVLVGEPFYQGGPAGTALASRSGVEFKPGAGARTKVAVLDTGISKGIHKWLDTRCTATAGDAEELNVQPADGWIDDEAGHGTFIAGVVLQRAPSTSVSVAKVLDSEGYGDEVGVARAIVRFAKNDVLNLSLGGYSHGDVPPLSLVAALRRVSRDSVVVAAAGNNSSDRLMWPAAMKRVIAVGALDRSGKKRAPFSNYGWWVDCCTPAVDVLSSFVAFDESAAPAMAGRTPQAFDGWATWSGTSFAAPKVAGEIVALKAAKKLATARAAADQLLAGTEWLPDLGVVLKL